MHLKDSISAMKNCNTLPMIQSIMQNDRCSLDIQRRQVNFEMVLEILECKAEAVQSWTCNKALNMTKT
jgi:uncharacterized protein YfcZ (UPF0381/DUF406 family)